MLSEKCIHCNSPLEASFKNILGHLYEIVGGKYSVCFKCRVYLNFLSESIPVEGLLAV